MRASIFVTLSSSKIPQEAIRACTRKACLATLAAFRRSRPMGVLRRYRRGFDPLPLAFMERKIYFRTSGTRSQE